MLKSLAFILIFGFSIKLVFEHFKLPGLLGMLFFGILIGPNSLNLIDESILTISPDLRNLALIIILLRAGLGIERESLKNVGFSAFKLSFIPGLLEGLTIALVAQKLLGFSFIEGGILGFILAAVSPAVVVPSMIQLMDKKLGTNKDIPTLIISGASIDDVFAITIFTSFINLYFNTSINIFTQLLNIPLSILLGLFIGYLINSLLSLIFNKFNLSSNDKTLLVFSMSLLFFQFDSIFKGRVKIASLLGIMFIGFLIRESSYKDAYNLSIAFNKMWDFAQIFLFTLIGAEVNIHLIFKSTGLGLVIIFIGLLSRSVGVLLSINNLDYTLKEKLFCIISYLPKATVQAAIGGIPLSLGLPSGDKILNIAVLSIVVTAPLGSFLIRYSSEKLLTKG